jgi:thiamine pyrophosphate-dependent acetolactate synthase large subunit-like protein
MKRLFCGGLIKDALAADDLVVCSLGSVNRTWRAMNAPQPAYFCSDPMGIALSIGLGLALAKPKRRVALLCGDGELTMSLSSLVTVAGAAAPNLRIVVFNNGRYETGGAQPLPGAATLSFAAIARGAGIKWAEDADTEATAQAAIETLFGLDHTGLVSLTIDAEPLSYGPAIALSQAEERTLFMQRLAELD